MFDRKLETIRENMHLNNHYYKQLSGIYGFKIVMCLKKNFPATLLSNKTLSEAFHFTSISLVVVVGEELVLHWLTLSACLLLSE